MALQIIEELGSNKKPVNEPKILKPNQIRLQDFNGELSSDTGIQSKGLYITRFSGFDSTPDTPTITILSDGYFHIDKSKILYAKGIDGKTWIKKTSFIPIDMVDDKVEDPYINIKTEG